MSPPLPEPQLRQIVLDACDSALSGVSSYAHSSTESWNKTIINNILSALVSATTPSAGGQPPFKYCVNSTIIQHTSAPTATHRSTSTNGGETSAAPSATDSSTSSTSTVGRRGMHSATGAYWNNDKDGMWSHKFEGGDEKGMDVVISVMWVAV